MSESKRDITVEASEVGWGILGIALGLLVIILCLCL